MVTTGLSRITQIAQSVRDIKRAVGFYRDVLGMRLLFEAPPGIAFFDCDGVRLMLSPVELAPQFQPPGSVLYFQVDDIRQKHTELAALGVQFTSEPRMVAKLPDREVWLADFEDTEGNVLALMAEPKL
jgi:methylmalonyl-CoA/ethylmalonyl-CoA epimerase